MKKLLLLTSVIFILVFSGCTAKGKIDSNGGSTKADSNVTSTNSTSKDSGVTDAAKDSNSQGSNSATSKPLNSSEKEKIDSIIDSINSSLKSLDDIKDIDLSSIN